MTTSTPDLGNVITSARVRKIIYGVYVVLIVIAGACQVAYAALQLAEPGWLTAGLAVLAYLGVPVGGLALANTTKTIDAVAAVPGQVSTITSAPAPSVEPDADDTTAKHVAG